MIYKCIIFFLLDGLVDRNCSNCNRNCIDYQTWLRVQNCLHKVVRDPLFELFIMACIICNTIVLAIEHHGMSQNVRNILDVGNKVINLYFTKNYIILNQNNKHKNHFIK